MDKTKILIVAGAMDLGGIENQLMHLLRNADKNKFQIDFTATEPNAYYLPEIRALGGTVHLIPHMSTKNPLPYCKALKKIMVEGHYDIVHSHELFHSGIVLALAHQAGVPGRFVHAHNWSDGTGDGKKRPLVRTIYNAAMQRSILNHSTCRIACSTLAGKFLYGDDADFHLVFNSVDTGKFLDHYDDQETGEFCGDGWVNVLQVGRITLVKNQMFLVKIADEFRRRGKKIRILCAGSGDEAYQAQLESKIHRRGLQEYIQLLGVRSDIDVLMRKSQAFVLPSQYEGMPLVLIEAQAAGLPCVTADTFSHEVDFELGKVRWMQLSAGASAWADAIETAVTSRKAQKADVIRTVEEKRFDSKLFTKTLCDLYEQSAREHL